MDHTPTRRFRFSLRTLFIGVTVVGLLCGFGWNVHCVRERERLQEQLLARGALFGSTVSDKSGRQAPLVWRMLGVKPVGVIVLSEDCFDATELRRIAARFPEAEIRTLTGHCDDSIEVF